MCDLFAPDSTAVYAPHNGGKPKLMDFDLYKHVIDQSCDIITVYHTQLRGEPFMHPRFLDMLAYTREKAPRASISFNTNGYLMTADLVDRALAIGVNSWSISIDAAKPATYEKIRVRSDLARVEANIDHLLRARENPALQVRPEVNVSFVLQDENDGEKEEFLRRWLARVDNVLFYTKVNFDRSRPARFFEPAPGRKPCQSLDHSMAVLSDGAVTPCCGDITPLEVLGYIQDKPLREIAGAGRYVEMRNLHAEGRADSIPVCASCDTWIAYEKKSWDAKIRPAGAFWPKHCTVTQSPVSEIWTMRRP